MIQFSLSVERKCVRTEEMVPNWSMADWSGMRAGLSNTDCTERLANLEANEAWEVFSGKKAELVEENVPVRPCRMPNRPVWMNWEVLRAVRRKRKLWERARCGRKEMTKYKRAEKQAARMIRNAKRNFEMKLARENSGNCRHFFAYI
jgi:hypothetical protein